MIKETREVTVTPVYRCKLCGTLTTWNGENGQHEREIWISNPVPGKPYSGHMHNCTSRMTGNEIRSECKLRGALILGELEVGEIRR